MQFSTADTQTSHERTIATPSRIADVQPAPMQPTSTSTESSTTIGLPPSEPILPPNAAANLDDTDLWLLGTDERALPARHIPPAIDSAGGTGDGASASIPPSGRYTISPAEFASVGTPDPDISIAMPIAPPATTSASHALGTHETPAATAPPNAVDRVSIRSATGNATITFNAHGDGLQGIVAAKAPPGPVHDIDLPYGFFGFTVTDVVPGGIATVDLTLPKDAKVDGYFKQDSRSLAISRFDFDGQTGAVINGNTVTLYLQDGGRGDDDGTVNGVVVDPGGPGGGSNQPPVAVADNYTVVHDGTLETNLLANDTDPHGNPLTVVSVSAPAHGTLTFQAGNFVSTGVFVYGPNPQYVGSDSLTYKISDGTSESGPATVSITVANEVPVGEPDSFTGTSEDFAISGNVQDNDFDTDGEPTRSLVATSTSHGDLILVDDGSFTYTPYVNYFGPDSFTYTLTDGVATTNPITVSLTVPPGGPFDLDGHDRSTQTVWMPEPDEQGFGLGVSVSDNATIVARVYNVPPDMVIDRRRINFNPYVLSVNGVTQPGYIELSTGGANEVLTVTALVEGYGLSAINYEVLTHFNGGGPGLATLYSMPVVEQKAVLRQLEFTSDHNVIRNNTLIDSESGDRYKDVEFVRRTKYNAPMTQTMSYVGALSKMKVKVTVDWAGIPADTPVKLVGTSLETALQFESGLKSTGDLPGEGTVEITASNDVGGVRTINGTIEWKMIVNPGAANEKTLAMGTSGAHKVYVLFGTPGKQDKKPFQATDIRMDRTVAVAKTALENALAAVPPGTSPKLQRIVYQVVKLQKFSLKVNKVQLPLNDDWISLGWRVYNTWTEDPPGADCISGATFSWLVVVASGMPGTSSVDAFVAKSETEPTKAVSWVADDPAHLRNENKEEIFHLDTSDRPNRFEATVIYTPPGAGASTFYFPVGVTGDPRFTNKDDVITTFKSAVWLNRMTGAQVGPVITTYTRAADANID